MEGFNHDQEVLKLHSYQVLARLFFEQCELSPQAAAPEKDDVDAQEAAVPVVLKESKEVSSASLQSPHDVDVTYSGHKGKGYEVQVAETAGNGEKPELITHVEATPSCQSDEAATAPTVEALAQREIQSQELITDTNYASAANVMGFLRVRGGSRVRLAVYFKALACNVKRMVAYLAQQANKAAKELTPTAEQTAAGPKPAASALSGCLWYSGALWRPTHEKRFGATRGCRVKRLSSNGGSYDRIKIPPTPQQTTGGLICSDRTGVVGSINQGSVTPYFLNVASGGTYTYNGLFGKVTQVAGNRWMKD